MVVPPKVEVEEVEAAAEAEATAEAEAAAETPAEAESGGATAESPQGEAETS